MANSCSRLPVGHDPFEAACRTPGPLGINDAASPDTPPWFLGDTPGPNGINCQDDPQTALKAKDDISKPAVVNCSCACNRNITLDELCQVFVKQKRKVCEDYLPHINATFRNYEITTCLRKAHFLAQIGHESGELRYTAEILKKKKESEVYDGYKGRGLIQITWGKNYKAYGKYVHHDFLGDRRMELEQPKWATDSAGWYWTSGSGKDLNKLADKNDLLAISARVNGGFNGFEDRKIHFKCALKALKVKDCKAAAVGSNDFLPFKQSEIYNNFVHSFAWGCWNDVKSKKTGVVQSPEERRNGYNRFLELYEQRLKRHGKPVGLYNFSAQEALSLAKEGCK